MSNVNNPQHYNVCGIECIDIIEAALGPEGFRAFCLGNVIKYRWRAPDKNGGEDLAKADVYATWASAGTAKGREHHTGSYTAGSQRDTPAIDVPEDDPELHLPPTMRDDATDGLRAGGQT
jgi:hypothetical protein